MSMVHTGYSSLVLPADPSIAKTEIKEEEGALATIDLTDTKDETPFTTYKTEPKIELEPTFELETKAENVELDDSKDEPFETMQVDGANDEKPPDNKPTEQRRPTVMNLQSVLPNVKATILNTGGEDPSGGPKTVVVLNKDGTRMTLQLVKSSTPGASNATVVCQSSSGTTSTSTVAALAQAIEARKMITRSKTGSLTPKQFTDSVTAPPGNLKIALTKCIEDSPRPSSLTTTFTNKEAEQSYITRSKISIGNVSSTVLSQRSLFFKLGRSPFMTFFIYFAG